MARVAATTDPTGAYLELGGTGSTQIKRPDPELEFIPGGQASLVDLAPVRGVYATHPAMFPKYHPGNTTAAVSRQARMFVLVEDVAAYSEYIARCAERHPRAKRIVETLAVTSPTTGGAGGYGYVDFIVQSVSLSDGEFHQIHEVMADSHVTYFSGRQAPQLQISGLLLNTQQDDWTDAFRVLYDVVIRGTRLAQDNRLLGLRIDSRIYFVTPIAMQESMNSSTEIAVNFNMSCSVKRIVMLNTVRQHQVPTNLRALGGDAPLADVLATPGLQDGLTQVATRTIYAYSEVGRGVVTQAPTLIQQALESDAGRRLAYVARKQLEPVRALGNAVLNAVTGQATVLGGDPSQAALPPTPVLPQTTTAQPSTARLGAQPLGPTPDAPTASQAANSAALQSVFGTSAPANNTRVSGARNTVTVLTSPDF